MSTIDTTLHPSPSGAAADLVASHSTDSPPDSLTLYGSWFCPFVQRAWIVLVEKRT
jgi:glutathione S-transferase